MERTGAVTAAEAEAMRVRSEERSRRETLGWTLVIGTVVLGPPVVAAAVAGYATKSVKNAAIAGGVVGALNIALLRSRLS